MGGFRKCRDLYFRFEGQAVYRAGAVGKAVKDFLLRKTLSCHCFGVFRRSSAFAPDVEHTHALLVRRRPNSGTSESLFPFFLEEKSFTALGRQALSCPAFLRICRSVSGIIFKGHRIHCHRIHLIETEGLAKCRHHRSEVVKKSGIRFI